jgi:transcription initiation factor TFIID subunit 5
MAAAVYSTDRETPLRLLTGHLSDVNAVCWHENATLVATCSDDRTARLFDIRTGKCVRLFGGSPSALCSVALTAFSASGGVSSLLAAGSDLGAVTVWDVGSGRRVSVLGGHRGAVHSVAFSADAAALATAGADCSVRVYGVQASIAHAPPYTPAQANTPATSSTAAVGYTNLLPPRHTYFTKYSPVFHLGYTDRHLLYAGGAFSLDSAIAEATATEQETASLLGLSQAVLGT